MSKTGRSLVLCGFMGSGKSTVGQILAKKLFAKYVDLDELIEKKQKMSIPDIFEKKGEAYFRALEHVELQNALSAPIHIISTGGGTFMDPDNVQLLKEHEPMVVYLSTDFDICMERVKDSPRPLLKRLSEDELRELYEERDKIFREICDTQMYNHQKPDTTAENIITLINPLNIQKL